MTITRRIIWAGAAIASFAWPVLLAAGIAQANGIGDVYVGAGKGVIEAHLAGKAVVTTVTLPAEATSVAFSPDGGTLYVATGEDAVQVIDIETISRVEAITASGPVVAVAHPAGSRVVFAIPELARVALVNPDDGTSNDVPVSGPVDLLAADRRVGVFLAAATTGGWVSVIDAALGTSHTLAVDGRVTGLAVDRDSGGAYVATRNPDTVSRIVLGTAKVDWTVKVDGAPTAVAAVHDRAVVATGERLLGVTSSGARTFATLPAAAVALAGTDDGKVLVAATGSRLAGFSSSGGDALAEVDLGKAHAAAIAPVPKPIALEGARGTAKPVVTPAPQKSGGAHGPGGSGEPTTSPSKGTSKGPRVTHPPTSTDALPGLPDGTPPLLGAAVVGTGILATWWGVQLVREHRSRVAARRVRVAAGRPRRRRRRRREPPAGS